MMSRRWRGCSRLSVATAGFSIGMVLTACGSDREHGDESTATSTIGPESGSGSGSGGGGEGSGDDSSIDPDDGRIGEVGMRRLSRREMDDTLSDLLGDESRAGTRHLPEDISDPFDNDFSTQTESSVLIEGIERLAMEVSSGVFEDPSRRAEILGCTPSGSDDRACMTRFVERFGRRVLRRPVLPAEVSAWVDLGLEYADGRDDFHEGADVVLRLLLQHPHFIYRIETGTETADPGVFKLDGFEVASRLSYFLWGSTPDDVLLDAAAAGDLDSPSGVAEAAERLLHNERTRDRIDRFHSLWLGYSSLPHDADLTRALRLESRALIEHVVFERESSWLDVFTATGTFVDDMLAEHYGLPKPGSDEFSWVEYGASGRQGLLSHGSFLSLGTKFDDTSPTMRGLAIRTRLFCQVIPPPPADVDVDNPPKGGDENACKTERYQQHANDGTCSGCHSLLDPIGFGLENFDQAGRFRTHEVDNPECAIPGEGMIDGVAFSGPAGLADYLIESEIVDECLVHQLYRFAMGHAANASDAAFLDDLLVEFRSSGHHFTRLLTAIVSDEAFGFRKALED